MAEQLFQIGVKGLIRNERGEVLMVHIPAWAKNSEHWDLPGGRMNPGESFLETLARELQEEIGMPYVGAPKQLTAMLTNITIPVGDTRVPLVFVIFEAMIADANNIKLDQESDEDDYGWFSPAEAAENMKYKFSDEFCSLVRNLAS